MSDNKGEKPTPGQLLLAALDSFPNLCDQGGLVQHEEIKSPLKDTVKMVRDRQQKLTK